MLRRLKKTRQPVCVDAFTGDNEIVALHGANTLGDVSAAFLHAAMSGEVFVWPPKEFYPNGDCLWKLKKAVYGLRQAPKLWEEHFAEVINDLTNGIQEMQK